MLLNPPHFHFVLHAVPPNCHHKLPLTFSFNSSHFHPLPHGHTLPPMLFLSTPHFSHTDKYSLPHCPTHLFLSFLLFSTHILTLSHTLYPHLFYSFLHITTHSHTVPHSNTPFSQPQILTSHSLKYCSSLWSLLPSHLIPSPHWPSYYSPPSSPPSSS